jgi:hypothetical protein
VRSRTTGSRPPQSARTGTIWPSGSAKNSGWLQVSRIRWLSSSVRR